jgi:lysozyme
MLKADEGLAKLLPDGMIGAYLDSRGIWSIGYGCNLIARGLTPALAAVTKWTQQQAEEQFKASLNKVISELNADFPDWIDLCPARQAVAVSACYQLGVAGVEEFKPTIALIKAGQYAKAAQHMLASEWGKQTPERVQKLATMMQTGEWPA